jgi:hypothetical protein
MIKFILIQFSSTQVISIPKAKGLTTVNIASSVQSAGGARIEEGSIIFYAGPDRVSSVYVETKVLVQNANEKIPPGYKDAGEVTVDGDLVKVLVDFND